MENKQPDSFVIYRMPFESKTHLIEGNCQTSLENICNLKGNNFVISPFNNGQKAFYIPFNTELEFKGNENLQFHFITLQEPTKDKENRYNEIIDLAKKQMLNGSLEKVVLANKKEIILKNFNAIEYFRKIELAYKNAFVYLLSCPQMGVWIGATPEPLLTTNDSVHKTIALAGTILKDGEQTFGTKEWHEQNIVEVFIENKLKDNKIEYSKNGPFPHESAKLVHLKTEYTFNAQATNDRIFPLLEDLNPTPATAGIPKETAINFINKNEGFDRQLYTGFLGLQKEDNLNLYVNLRCMQYANDQLTLYAGAGITIDSIATNEWLETQNKMKTLESYL
jgi:isochorismate synthase